jgi:HTH-type transcriptional regulator, sugar sensing transcriptional regulator
MDVTELKKIGLTAGEVKIYDALLELGESSRTELAKKSGVSPSKIYDVANRLLEKGIISCVKKQGVMHFSAANPERLRDFIELKEEELLKEKNLVDSILPSLLLKYQMKQEDVDVEVFYGWEGLKTAYSGIVKALGKGDVNYIFGASMGHDSKQADLFFSKYNKQADKAGYKIKAIFNENVRNYEARIGFYVKHKLHEIKYLYQDTFTELNFYKDTVLFVMLLKKPIVIRVRNKDAANSFKKFFEMMWKLAKD